MAVEHMKLLSIVGKESNMNNFISTYLLNSGLQPEDALKVFEKGWKLSCFDYDTVSRDAFKKCTDLLNTLKIQFSSKYSIAEIETTSNEIIKKIKPIEDELNKCNSEILSNSEKINQLEKYVYPISKLENVKIDLDKFYNLRYIKYRYGRIKTHVYDKIKKEVNKLDVILFELEQDSEYTWLMYFTTKDFETDVDSYFNIMKFERFWLPDEFNGVPTDVLNKINIEIKKYKKNIDIELENIQKVKKENESFLLFAYRQLATLVKVDSIKKYMAHDNNNNFYIIGWIPKSELDELLPKISKETDIRVKVKNHDEVANTPPTHLKNNKIISKFETIVEMYGIPNYKETDPTTFVAITAFLMFGFMFGDVGQGLIISIIGFFLYKKKKSLGPILISGGISSIIFGFLYGSIFGKEEIIPALLISPMKNITTMLISGISFGAFLILISMLINIKNGIRFKDKKKIFFSENGIAGLLFYSIILITIVYFAINGKLLVSAGILGSILLLLLLVILFKDKLGNIVSKTRQTTKNSAIEKIFEIIEMLLSIASNTISFVRLAAFAINHVGLCMAVYILSNMLNGVRKFCSCNNWKCNSYCFRRINCSNSSIKTRIL